MRTCSSGQECVTSSRGANEAKAALPGKTNPVKDPAVSDVKVVGLRVEVRSAH